MDRLSAGLGFRDIEFFSRRFDSLNLHHLYFALGTLSKRITEQRLSSDIPSHTAGHRLHVGVICDEHNILHQFIRVVADLGTGQFRIFQGNLHTHLFGNLGLILFGGHKENVRQTDGLFRRNNVAFDNFQVRNLSSRDDNGGGASVGQTVIQFTGREVELVRKVSVFVGRLESAHIRHLVGIQHTSPLQIGRR